MNKTIVTKKSNSINVKVGSNKNQSAMPGVVMEYGVKSVNGQTGNIILDADDVKAISYDKVQELTDEQAQQARVNIKLLPSETLPIMDGEASTGTEIEYARGDHIHPTDTSRASQVEFSEFKSNVENNYATKEYVDNVTVYITDIQVNGESLPVEDHTVNIVVPTAYSLAGDGLTVDYSSDVPKLVVKLGEGLEFDDEKAIRLQDELILDCGSSTTVISA